MLVVCLTGEASRSDATVDFEVSLSCIPGSRPMILLTPVRDSDIGENMFVSLSASRQPPRLP